MNKFDSKIRFWLLVCAGMVLIMIGLGGYTRLSGSGLSIVHWRPITGILPPLSTQQWIQMFDLYKQSPEFLKINSGMSLPDFQFIYMVEFIHRLWGRLMGFVLLIPTGYALYAQRSLMPRISAIWILAGAQAAMGWYMVKSGLIDNPQVSPIRLTLHLCLALTILAMILNTIHTISKRVTNQQDLKMRPVLAIMTAILAITICFGGLTAGNHAGLIYNTFPDMNGHLLPEEIFNLHPVWHNFLYNPATIQFIHRLLAFISLAVGFYIALQGGISNKLKHVNYVVAGCLILQVILGVSTLVLQVPIPLGVAHQVWASITFAIVYWAYLLSGKQWIQNPVAN